MDNNPQPQTAGHRREPSIDPVKAQGILIAVNRKQRHAARVWQERWGFYSRIQQIREEEAQKIGMSLEEYRNAVRSLSGNQVPKILPVEVDPSPTPVPITSAGVIGRRAQCPLERYGRLLKTGRDYPVRPPLPPGQIYDPYKQTLMFIRSVEGDPISYKLPPSHSDVTDDMWAAPKQLDVTPFDILQQI